VRIAAPRSGLDDRRRTARLRKPRLRLGWHRPGGRSGLQNRQGGVARRLVGSIPAPPRRQFGRSTDRTWRIGDGFSSSVPAVVAAWPLMVTLQPRVVPAVDTCGLGRLRGFEAEAHLVHARRASDHANDPRGDPSELARAARLAAGVPREVDGVADAWRLTGPGRAAAGRRCLEALGVRAAASRDGAAPRDSNEQLRLTDPYALRSPGGSRFPRIRGHELAANSGSVDVLEVGGRLPCLHAVEPTYGCSFRDTRCPLEPQDGDLTSRTLDERKDAAR
jgi:hypothetical protein